MLSHNHTLEILIEQNSLRDVLQQLVDICTDKAERADTKELRRAWNKAASELDVTLTRVTRFGI
jgi:hypothetical protein